MRRGIITKAGERHLGVLEGTAVVVYCINERKARRITSEGGDNLGGGSSVSGPDPDVRLLPGEAPDQTIKRLRETGQFDTPHPMTRGEMAMLLGHVAGLELVIEIMAGQMGRLESRMVALKT